MASKLKVSKALSRSRADPVVLLQELKKMAPDIWDGRKRCSILPQKLGGLEEPEYIERLQNVIRKLTEYVDMLNAELISQAEYECRKAEVLYDIGPKVAHSPFRNI